MHESSLQKKQELKRMDIWHMVAMGQVYQAKKILTRRNPVPSIADQMGVHIELEEKHNMITVTEKAIIL